MPRNPLDNWNPSEQLNRLAPNPAPRPILGLGAGLGASLGALAGGGGAGSNEPNIAGMKMRSLPGGDWGSRLNPDGPRKEGAFTADWGAQPNPTLYDNTSKAIDDISSNFATPSRFTTSENPDGTMTRTKNLIAPASERYKSEAEFDVGVEASNPDLWASYQTSPHKRENKSFTNWLPEHSKNPAASPAARLIAENVLEQNPGDIFSGELKGMPAAHKSAYQMDVFARPWEYGVPAGAPMVDPYDPEGTREWYQDHAGKVRLRYPYALNELDEAGIKDAIAINEAFRDNDLLNYDDLLAESARRTDLFDAEDFYTDTANYYSPGGGYEESRLRYGDDQAGSLLGDINALRDQYNQSYAMADARRDQFDSERALALNERSAREAEASLLRDALADTMRRDQAQAAYALGAHRGGGTVLDRALLDRQGQYAADAAKLMAAARIKEAEDLSQYGTREEALKDALKLERDAGDYLLKSGALERVGLNALREAREAGPQFRAANPKMLPAYLEYLNSMNTIGQSNLLNQLSSYEAALSPYRQAAPNVQGLTRVDYTPDIQEPKMKWYDRLAEGAAGLTTGINAAGEIYDLGKNVLGGKSKSGPGAGDLVGGAVSLATGNPIPLITSLASRLF